MHEPRTQSVSNNYGKKTSILFCQFKVEFVLRTYLFLMVKNCTSKQLFSWSKHNKDAHCPWDNNDAKTSESPRCYEYVFRFMGMNGIIFHETIKDFAAKKYIKKPSSVIKLKHCNSSIVEVYFSGQQHTLVIWRKNPSMTIWHNLRVLSKPTFFFGHCPIVSRHLYCS